MAVITLTTDFGTLDPYVGIMKGVILTICPDANIVDITHHVEQGDILCGSIILRESYRFFPKGSVHVAVVDPGVGGERRPIAISGDGYFFVGPDNGIFWPIIEGLRDFKVVHLKEPRFFLKEISYTFHGRDIFAPVAAHLLKGVDILDMGDPISDPVKLKIPTCTIGDDTIEGEVIRVDRFGNLITNIDKESLDRFKGNRLKGIYLNDLHIAKKISKSYEEAGEGNFLAIVGSSNLLEISLSMGNACKKLNLTRDQAIGKKIKVIYKIKG